MIVRRSINLTSSVSVYLISIVVFTVFLSFLSPRWLLISNQASFQNSNLGPVLVSYSFFQKDEIQKTNFEFFLAAGTVDPVKQFQVDYVYVISGDECDGCSLLKQYLYKKNENLQNLGIESVWTNGQQTMIYRTVNEGMDIAAHNLTLTYLQYKDQYRKYRYFIFLNSSVKGPFYPKYMPNDWHWTEAFTSKFNDKVKAVGSSLVCLPEVDAGGPGPRLESWAFAVDKEGLEVLRTAGVFFTRECKHCDDGIIVNGEYGITIALFKKGYHIATLMSKYPDGVDWQQGRHWHCNDNAHPSRHGTYENISMHPYETVFVKSSWHVADVYTKRYSAWKLKHLAGKENTEGYFDEQYYKYALDAESQIANNQEECYVPPNLNAMMNGIPI